VSGHVAAGFQPPGNGVELRNVSHSLTHRNWQAFSAGLEATAHWQAGMLAATSPKSGKSF
jgi:hypothetical protein